MDVVLKWKIVRIIITSTYLMVGWILFTGTLALFSLLLGSIFSFFIALATYTLFIGEKEAARRSLLPHLYLVFIYMFVLLVKFILPAFTWSQV